MKLVDLIVKTLEEHGDLNREDLLEIIEEHYTKDKNWVAPNARAMYSSHLTRALWKLEEQNIVGLIRHDQWQMFWTVYLRIQDDRRPR